MPVTEALNTKTNQEIPDGWRPINKQDDIHIGSNVSIGEARAHYGVDLVHNLCRIDMYGEALSQADIEKIDALIESNEEIVNAWLATTDTQPPEGSENMSFEEYKAWNAKQAEAWSKAEGKLVEVLGQLEFPSDKIVERLTSLVDGGLTKGEQQSLARDIDDARGIEHDTQQQSSNVWEH